MTLKRSMKRSLWATVLLGLASSSALAFEPEGVPAGKPYQIEGVVERVRLADQRLVVDGTIYRYYSPVIHPPEGAKPTEVEAFDERLRPGMRVGMRLGRGSPRPVLEVWVLR